ncbi:MAG: NADH:ubiquinone reductase (Na(+)-transporting) subunit C [Hyphomicrobiales bacterium]
MPNPVGALFARPNDDTTKTVTIAVLVAFVCAILVSTASVLLDPIQQAQIEAEQAARMEAMLDTLPGMREFMEEAGVTALETRIVDLQTGRFAPDIDPATYDFAAASNDPELSVAIPTDADLASIRQRPIYAPVYLLERDGDLLLIVLPVYGSGYASTIRAMLALEPDLSTVAALTITEQAETPGLGARITEPDWQSLWPGKELLNEDGDIVIQVVRGQAQSVHEVDGLSGATRTGDGVTFALQFWMGPDGYGPFLDRLAEEGL